MRYLGQLSTRDFLHPFLRYEILPQLGMNNGSPRFSVRRFNASNQVYLYEEESSRVRVVGKFLHLPDARAFADSQRHLDREFDSLAYLRSLGFDGYPHYVPRPLGRNADLNCLLVTEYCRGKTLSPYLKDAAQGRNSQKLFGKLTALAYFLSRLHNRTANGLKVEFDGECEYFKKLAQQAGQDLGLQPGQERRLFQLCAQWAEKPCVWEDQQVLAHGDATPANFLFGDGLWVIVLDLERMKRADRVFDVGRMAAEIKHYFMQYGSGPEGAEPFVRHFLWEYACHFPDRAAAFAAICKRVPFYMGLTFLRISRNAWLESGYRHWLVQEAVNTLEAGMLLS